MGSNTNKIYNKAMDYYQNGEIDKALEKCEEGISQDLKNSNLLTKVIETILTNGGEINNIENSKPTLENVFLALTGKKLRD